MSDLSPQRGPKRTFALAVRPLNSRSVPSRNFGPVLGAHLKRDATDLFFRGRAAKAKSAGLSDREGKAALRLAAIPLALFMELVETKRFRRNRAAKMISTLKK
jgi:hypothetical protein